MEVYFDKAIWENTVNVINSTFFGDFSVHSTSTESESVTYILDDEVEDGVVWARWIDEDRRGFVYVGTVKEILNSM